MFHNEELGYYKVSIERPKRLKAQFSQDRIETLRFERTLKEPMAWAYAQFGEEVYTRLAKHEKAILEWAEKQELNLNAKQSKALVSPALWQKQLELLNTAAQLMHVIGVDEYSDFNIFREKLDAALKQVNAKLTASDKNNILNAVSWYDASAEKVIKGTVKLTGDKLEEVLKLQDCKEAQLPDHGYYPTGKKGEYVQYEADSELRDSENVPLKDNIYQYFLKEVKPHVAEAWINMETVKIGYEISFNKYFYRHKPLRSLEEVTADILQLERESDGLIREILNLG